MTNNRIISYLFILAIIIFTQSCKKDNGDFEQQALDQDLEVALNNASDGAGKGHFILPESNDYNQIPQDENNPLNTAKIALGSMLYHETGMALNAKHSSGTGTYSCATCHSAAAGFQAGRRQGIADGGIGFGLRGEGRDIAPGYTPLEVDVQPIRTPSTLNSAYQEVMLWNGQFGAKGPNENTSHLWTEDTPKETNGLGYEGVETQAIAGVGVHRMSCDETTIKEAGYDGLFDQAFPDEPEDTRYSGEHGGLAIAAYERTLLANQAPFQRWLRGENTALSAPQKRGAILFFDRAGCYTCHNGPALSSMTFHALGMSDLEGSDLFGEPVDDATRRGRGGFTNEPSDDFKFKVPQLYNLTDSPFYGHGGSFTALGDVIRYKNEAIPQKQGINLSPEFSPLKLSDGEVADLTAFVAEGLYDNNLKRYEPEALLSGLCFPNNDEISRTDLGCD